jgi:hypothetical protein
MRMTRRDWLFAAAVAALAAAGLYLNHRRSDGAPPCAYDRTWVQDGRRAYRCRGEMGIVWREEPRGVMLTAAP